MCLQIDELTTELESMKNHQLNPVLEGQNPTDIVRKYQHLHYYHGPHQWVVLN